MCLLRLALLPHDVAIPAGSPVSVMSYSRFIAVFSWRVYRICRVGALVKAKGCLAFQIHVSCLVSSYSFAIPRCMRFHPNRYVLHTMVPHSGVSQYIVLFVLGFDCLFIEWCIERLLLLQRDSVLSSGRHTAPLSCDTTMFSQLS